MDTKLLAIKGKKAQDSVFSSIPPIVIWLVILIILLIIFGIIFRDEVPKLLEGIWNVFRFGGW